MEEAIALPMTTNPLHAGESRDTKAGFLLKQGHKVRNWKRRWFVLRGQTLLYFRKAGDEEPAGAFCALKLECGCMCVQLSTSVCLWMSSSEMLFLLCVCCTHSRLREH